MNIELGVRPLLVVISGAPGAGKTTLARVLSERLHLPVVNRDLLKTGFHVTARSEDPAEIHRFATPAFELFYSVVETQLAAGVSTICEAAFHVEHSRPCLQALSGFADVAHISVRPPASVALDRYVARAERGERHPAHGDFEQVQCLRADVSQYVLDEPTPLLTVDTSGGYQPDLDQIADFIDSCRTPATIGCR